MRGRGLRAVEPQPQVRAVEPQPQVRAAFIEAVAGILQSLGLGPEFCRQQPENREAWERVASALEVQQARAGFRLIKGGAR